MKQFVRAYMDSLHRDVTSTSDVRVLRLQGGVLVLESVRHGIEHLAVFAVELVDHAVVEGLGADDEHVKRLARQASHLVLVPFEGRVLCRKRRVHQQRVEVRNALPARSRTVRTD